MSRRIARTLAAFAAAYLCFSALSLPARAAPAAGALNAGQCTRDLATVDRSFAEAMRDLQRNAQSQERCTAWKRQIAVMRRASDVFARCIAEDSRKLALSQMEGSIADFSAMIVDAKCE